MRLLLILLGFFLTFLSVLFLKYYLLGYYDWDLAFFSQASWELLRGDQFVPLVGINFFGDHSYFIHIFVLPFFYLFPSPLTLIVLKLAAFCAAAYFIYRAAEERLGGGVPILRSLSCSCICCSRATFSACCMNSTRRRSRRSL